LNFFLHEALLTIFHTQRHGINFDFFRHAGVTGAVNGSSFFLEIPCGASKMALGTGFAVKINTGGAVDFRRFCVQITSGSPMYGEVL